MGSIPSFPSEEEEVCGHVKKKREKLVIVHWSQALRDRTLKDEKSPGKMRKKKEERPAISSEEKNRFRISAGPEKKGGCKTL